MLLDCIGPVLLATAAKVSSPNHLGRDKLLGVNLARRPAPIEPDGVRVCLEAGLRDKTRQLAARSQLTLATEIFVTWSPARVFEFVDGNRRLPRKLAHLRLDLILGLRFYSFQVQDAQRAPLW